MPETFKFGVETPLAGESAVVSVRCYESSDGESGWVVIDSVALGVLAPDTSGIYTWPSALANKAKYHMLVPVSATSIERAGGVILPPRPTDLNKTTAYLTVVTQGGVPAIGVELTATLAKVPTIINGVAVAPIPIKVKTGSNGLATLQLVKGARYNITTTPLGPKVEADTTGRDTLNIALQV